MTLTKRIEKLESRRQGGAAVIGIHYADSQDLVTVRGGGENLPPCKSEDFERLYPCGLLLTVRYEDWRE